MRFPTPMPRVSAGDVMGDVPVAPFGVLKPYWRTPKEYLPFCRGWEEARAYSKRGPRRPAGQHSGATRSCHYRPSFLFGCSTHREAQPPHQPCHSNTAAPIAFPAIPKDGVFSPHRLHVLGLTRGQKGRWMPLWWQERRTKKRFRCRRDRARSPLAKRRSFHNNPRGEAVLASRRAEE